MLYPKEDKEHKVLLYAVSKIYLLFLNTMYMYTVYNFNILNYEQYVHNILHMLCNS